MMSVLQKYAGRAAVVSRKAKVFGPLAPDCGKLPFGRALLPELSDRIVTVQLQNQLKRKRASNCPVNAAAEKDALVILSLGAREELAAAGWFEYYKEVSVYRLQLDGSKQSSVKQRMQ
ncbi:chromatin assembly factor 1 subunit FSM-like [Brachypodium distachyon]|uniref:chromatin assembly factor 1 subunit FSM-like n=1 Tax=Brachypodium distachyon TaxID=15368 RepID=UPI00071D1312|nr:chromatin assembly factor 1 subunit FSM-like [Brachypodium distachyon]|eukprot:XP_014755288.1 chromatin assembly factor 1 subunit FSM-like [Brachypodium distachyon]